MAKTRVGLKLIVKEGHNDKVVLSGSTNIGEPIPFEYSVKGKVFGIPWKATLKGRIETAVLPPNSPEP